MVVDTINSVGHAFTQTFRVIIQVNHFINEHVLGLVLAFVGHLKDAFLALMAAVQAALEDLAIFIAESVESVVNFGDFVFACVDAALMALINGCVAFKVGVGSILGGLCRGLESCLCAVVQGSTSFGHLLSLSWSSAIFLLSLIPKSVYLTTDTLCGAMRWLAALFSDAVSHGMDKVERAPVETFVGLVGGCLLLLSLRRLWSRSSLTVGQLIHLGLNAFCLVYFYIMKSLIFCARCVIKMVEMTLSHLHVTRFHHAGDDSDHDANDGALDANVDAESDENENERMSVKRRNYDLILQRRAQRRARRRRGSRNEADNEEGDNDDNDDTDVEEMLFEQMEREREDKLCVVCQDKEKCIMMLPCRHLCLCQDCQTPLLTRSNNHCPMCRRKVKQTIKAYL